MKTWKLHYVRILTHSTMFSFFSKKNLSTLFLMITQLWINQKCNETKFIRHSIRTRGASEILRYTQTNKHTHTYIYIFIIIQIVHKFIDLSQTDTLSV